MTGTAAAKTVTMMTALMILGGLSATSTLVIVAGLFAAKRAQQVEFTAGEIAFSSMQAPRESASTNSLAPAYSH